MAKLEIIHLLVQTRYLETDDGNGNKEVHSGSTNKIVVYYGLSENEKIDFQRAPPAPGMCDLRSIRVNIDYEDIVGRPFNLSIDGKNAWAPRWAFLYGEFQNSSKLVPLAMNIDGSNLDTWLSKDPNEKGIKVALWWPLTRIFHTTGLNEPQNTFILHLMTAGEPDPTTSGPLELSIFAKGEEESGRHKPYLFYQTILSQIDKEIPCESVGSYMAIFKGVPNFIPKDISRCIIINKSDDAWIGHGDLFCVNSDKENLRGRHLCHIGCGSGKYCQDPHNGQWGYPAESFALGKITDDETNNFLYGDLP